MHNLSSITDVIILAAGYLLSVFGGGWVIARFLEKVQTAGEPSSDGIPYAGKYIGWFERFLIVTFVLLGEMAAVGLVIAAKSILRLGQARQDRGFAEYVLLGTLASVSIAVAIGTAIRILIRLY